MFRRKLLKTIGENCNNVKLRAIFTSRPIFTFQSRDRSTKQATSNVVYQFTCICGKQYIGRTERRLKDRICEHLPTATNAKEKSSIAQHIVQSSHNQVDESNFKILLKGRNNRVLQFLEAVAIRILKPELNIQTPTDYQLKLNWR